MRKRPRVREIKHTVRGRNNYGKIETKATVHKHVGCYTAISICCPSLLLQNRSHPSIILWGVRINESVDDDAFYTRTNQIAHQLDPSRATSGVRYLEKSHLLEDVYAYNDFSHNGVTPGAKPKKDVTPDMGKALLISECNGHMLSLIHI